MKRMAIFFSMLFMLVVSGAQALTVNVQKTFRPYEDGKISVRTEEAGLLTILVSDRLGEEQPVVQKLNVAGGEHQFIYDATSYAGMPLRRGASTLSFLFEGESGRVERQTVKTTVQKPAAHLVYALPRSLAVYQQPLQKWTIDCAVTLACTVCFEVYKDSEKPIYTSRQKLANGGIFKLSWDLKKGGALAAPGEYRCRVYVAKQKEKAVAFTLSVLSGREAAPDVQPTGQLLPDALDDEALWTLMTQPMVVANAGSTEHVPVYAAIDGGDAVGTIHGQSQAVETIKFEKEMCLIRFYRQEDGQWSEGWISTKQLKAVMPDGRYGISINLTAQTLAVYEAGHPIGSARISTGREGIEGAIYRGTLPGRFVTVERIAAFVSKGYRYEYPIRIDGGNLIHQLGLNEKTASAADEVETLQTKASAGCVRVDYRTDDVFTINAYWLWTHIPYGTAVIVLP